MKRCINEDCRAELADSAEKCHECGTPQPKASVDAKTEEPVITKSGRRAARDLIRIEKGKQKANVREARGGPKADHACDKCKFHEKQSNGDYCVFRKRPPFAGKCNNWTKA